MLPHPEVRPGIGDQSGISLALHFADQAREDGGVVARPVQHVEVEPVGVLLDGAVFGVDRRDAAPERQFE